MITIRNLHSGRSGTIFPALLVTVFILSRGKILHGNKAEKSADLQVFAVISSR